MKIGRYASRAVSSRSTAASDNEDIAQVTIPSTKITETDCSDENIAATFQNNGYRTGMLGTSEKEIFCIFSLNYKYVKIFTTSSFSLNRPLFCCHVSQHCSKGKWHLSRFTASTYTYSAAQQTVANCGFDFVDALYIENLDSEGGYFTDETFSHNQEWLTFEAINFINQESTEPFFLYFNPTVPHSSNSVYTALTDFSCRNTANGVMDSDPMIEGMTQEFGSCDAYREDLLTKATTDQDLGALWLDDSIHALMIALENKGVLDNTVRKYYDVICNDSGC
mmetsp:Transcript_4371/g.5688  ORF Transcript_4371/g.5688 Transcript_4371/m.5688 type:complete len:279 (+) Transcript_4371:132-968(+)